jgi:hypothetical protein
LRLPRVNERYFRWLFRLTNQLKHTLPLQFRLRRAPLANSQ